jgi:hypothetical protein
LTLGRECQVEALSVLAEHMPGPTFCGHSIHQPVVQEKSNDEATAADAEHQRTGISKLALRSKQHQRDLSH